MTWATSAVAVATLSSSRPAATDGRSGVAAIAATRATAAGPTIYDFGFEDGTSGAFNNGGTVPFLAVAGTTWAIDGTKAYRGTRSVKNSYARSANNVGGFAMFYHDSLRSKVYIRFAYEQSNPFNDNGGGSNYDQAKLLRGKRAGVNGDPWVLEITPSRGNNRGALSFRFPEASPSGNYHANTANAPLANMNRYLGTFVIIEVMVNTTTNGAWEFQIWVNNVLTHDYTAASGTALHLTGANTWEWYQFDGTVNSMQQQSDVWFDDIGISTQKMGPP